MIINLRPNIIIRIWNSLHKCYKCRHPYFMHEIGGNYIECHSWKCECYEGDAYD